MTSLELQLNRLKTAATQSLAVEKQHLSLLFDRKEAASLDRESYYKLGTTGLAQLKRLDEHIDGYEPELFDEAALNLQRSTLSKDDAEKLNESLERMILHLSPYFHHQACKQVLEWLIYRFEIHLYSAEFLALAFLPYHSVNSYGRLLRILKLSKPEWSFASDYAKEAAPIPFNVLTKVCLAKANNQYLVGAFSSFLVNAIKSLGAEYVEQKLQMQFTFFTSLVVSLFEDSAKVTDQLIARIMPSVGLALKSRITPFKFAGIMIVCQIMVTTSLASEVCHNILKLLLLKIRPEWFETAMNTAFVIGQRQSLELLPTKPILKLMRKNDELNVGSYIVETMKSYDLTGFLIPFWNTLFHILKTEPEDPPVEVVLKVFVETLDLPLMTSEQAGAYLRLLLEFLSSSADNKVPKALRKHTHAIVIRFANAFDSVRAEWVVRDKTTVEDLMQQCKIEAHEVGELVMDEMEPKRRRRRSSSMRLLEDDPTFNANKPSATGSEENNPKKAQQMANLKAGTKEKKPYKDHVLSIAFLVAADQGDTSAWENATWALEALHRPEYVRKQTAEDLEEFFVQMVYEVVKNPKMPVKEQVKIALAQIKLNPKLTTDLIAPVIAQPTPKKAKANAAKDRVQATFGGETDEAYRQRIIFVLEVYNISVQLSATPELVRQLFDLVEKSNMIKAGPQFTSATSTQQLCMSLLAKICQGGQAVKLLGQNTQFDPLVKLIRFTHDHSVLRNALSVLTAAAPIIPAQVISQIMSVFAFMGDGLLKKDNETTLAIVEETLRALLRSLLKPDLAQRSTKHGKFQQQLLEVSRVLAASLMDIPAHRRLRMLSAIASTVPAEDLWIVLAVIFDDFCSRWQKTSNKRQDADALDDVSLELIGNLEPEYQLDVVVNLLDYVVHLSGDKTSSTTPAQRSFSLVIFDRATRPIQKLRHYRFIIFGFVLKCLNNRQLYDKLATLDDEEIYQRTLGIGKRLLATVMHLGQFVSTELTDAEKAEQKERGTETAPASIQALKYWIALAARADNICDKLRCLLPANVSGHIICDILDDPSVDHRMRDRALQLLNVKLLHQGIPESDAERGEKEGINMYLSKFAKKLNQWVKPAESKEEILLCQNAAFSLKLLAKRMGSKETQSIFTETMDKCMEVIKEWSSLDEAMVGNVLLLIGELVRSHNLRATMVHADTICTRVVEVLSQCVDQAGDVMERLNTEPKEAEVERAPGGSQASAEGATSRRHRVSQYSISGRQYGEDVLLFCGLTCVQRLLQHFAQFIPTYYESIVLVTCQLSAAYMPDGNLDLTGSITGPSSQNESTGQRLINIRQRLTLIRQAIAQLELRLLVEPLSNVSKAVLKKPITLRSACQLLADAIRANDTTKIKKSFEPLVELFFALFKCRHNEKRSETFAAYNDCEDAMISAFLAFADNLSEVDISPIISNLAGRVQTSINLGESKARQRLELLTIYRFLNRFYDEYNTLALPHVNRFFDYAPKILAGLNTRTNASDQLLINGRNAEGVEVMQADRLVTLVLDFIGKCARHSIFFTTDRAETVYKEVVDELENVRVQGHEERCVEHVTDCVYHIADTCNDLFSNDLCNRLLLKTRDKNSKVRYVTVLLFERLVDRIGDALSPLLPLIVQFLTEVLEDPNARVSEQCDKTIRLLREKFGDKVLGEDEPNH